MIPLDKKEARKRGLYRRSLIPEEERIRRSGMIFEKIRPLLDQYQVIGCYVSMRDEADTKQILQYCFDKGKTAAVPETTDSTLRFHVIHSFDDLTPGKFGVMEPVDCPVIPADRIELMIVPLSSFDAYNHRTGYGRGYYDSVLLPEHLKAGIAFSEQFVDHINADPWDIPLDLIVQA